METSSDCPDASVEQGRAGSYGGMLHDESVRRALEWAGKRDAIGVRRGRLGG